MTNQTLLTLSHTFIAIAAILGALGAFGSFYFKQRVESEKTASAAMTGVIEPRTNSTPLMDPAHQIYPILEMGDSGAKLMFAGKSGTPMFAFADKNGITIVKRDGQVKVSAIIRDRSGARVAELLENEWKVNRDNAWDRNYSKDALEVRDRNGDIVLQVRALPDRVQFQAKMYGPDGTGFAIGKLEGDGAMETRPPGIPLQLKIEPLFKYPSAQHLGELVRGK